MQSTICTSIPGLWLSLFLLLWLPWVYKFTWTSASSFFFCASACAFASSSTSLSWCKGFSKDGAEAESSILLLTSENILLPWSLLRKHLVQYKILSHLLLMTSLWHLSPEAWLLKINIPPSALQLFPGPLNHNVFCSLHTTPGLLPIHLPAVHTCCPSDLSLIITAHPWTSTQDARCSGSFYTLVGKHHCVLETGCDLEPGTLCCNSCTWTNVSWRNKIQRNYKGLKVTLCMCSPGKLWTARYKETKNFNCDFWRAGCKSRLLRMPAAHNTTKGVANHLSHPFRPTPGHLPTLTQGGASKQGKLLLVLTPCCCSTALPRA